MKEREGGEQAEMHAVVLSCKSWMTKLHKASVPTSNISSDFLSFLYFFHEVYIEEEFLSFNIV